MAATEDLFTPIHKAIRSMIYDVGARVQRLDFADPTASSAVLADLQHEFGNAVSATCVFCLLHEHAGSEERGVFPSMQAFDPALIRQLIDDHQEISRRLVAIAKRADELAAVGPADQRLALGIRINLEVNEFFAYYLGHMNKEEVTIVPAMREHYTDDQMRAMQGAIIGSLPPERLAAYARWMLPSLSLTELSAMLVGVKQGAPPQVFQLVTGVGAAYVDPIRWAAVRERVGF